jgi:hypothetical protein
MSAGRSVNGANVTWLVEADDEVFGVAAVE